MFVFHMQSRLSIACLWSPAGKVLTSWFSCVFRLLCFCHFPILILSWSTSGLRVILVTSNMFKPASNYILTAPRRCFFVDFFFAICVFLCYTLLSLQPCDHLLRNGWPPGSLVCEVTLCFCRFPIWGTRSSVIIGCIDSWSLPNSLL